MEEQSLFKVKNNKLPIHLSDGCVFIPRKVINDLRGGLINVTEFTFIFYLYLACNPYARCYINTRMLAEDIFRDEGKYDYSGEVLRSLKNKLYVDFENRQGKQGNFYIKMNDFLMHNGVFTSLSETSVQPVVPLPNPKLISKENVRVATRKDAAPDVQTGSNNNEKENDNKITNLESLKSFMNKEVFKR